MKRDDAGHILFLGSFQAAVQMVIGGSEPSAGDMNEMLEVLDFGLGSPGFRSHLCHYLAVCP